MKNPDRWIQIGVAAASIAAAAFVAVWIYTLQANGTAELWSVPTYAIVGVGAAGIVVTIVGLMAPNPKRSKKHDRSQTISAARASTNMQAGRDIRMELGNDDRADR